MGVPPSLPSLGTPPTPSLMLAGGGAVPHFPTIAGRVVELILLIYRFTDLPILTDLLIYLQFNRVK